MLKRRLRLIRWMARIRGRGPPPLTCRYFGAAFQVTPGELISDEIAINRIEWREITMMIAACREHRPDVFIDVGANVGLYSCIVGKAGIVSRVVSYEPNPEIFAKLVDNIGRNGLTRVVVPHRCAVGAERGTAFLTPGPPENCGLSKISGADRGGYRVDVVALDGELDVEAASIAIKIDVEGYELEVLAGAARLLAGNGGYAQIEGHGDERAAEITAVMAGHGWRLLDRYGLDLHFERVRRAREI